MAGMRRLDARSEIDRSEIYRALGSIPAFGVTLIGFPWRSKQYRSPVYAPTKHDLRAAQPLRRIANANTIRIILALPAWIA
jgi:hypothetical protein